MPDPYRRSTSPPASPGARRPPPPALVRATHRLDRLALHLLRRNHLERCRSGTLGPELRAALSAIEEAGPLPMGRVAALEQVSPSAMSRLVDTLEEEGLVARCPGIRDRRTRMVRATRAARPALERTDRRRSRWLSRRIWELPTGHKGILLRSIDLLEELALPGGHPFRGRRSPGRTSGRPRSG